MKTRNKITLLPIAVAMTGCVPCLHPLFTPGDVIVDHRIVGTWLEADGSDSWTFRKSDGKSYQLTITERSLASGENPGGQRSSKFEAHLLRLREFLFLDISPAKPGRETDLYEGLLLATHCFFEVSIETGLLRLAPLNKDWLENMIAQKKINIEYQRLDDSRILLTASTTELQTFALEFAKDSIAFSETEFHRQQGRQP